MIYSSLPSGRCPMTYEAVVGVAIPSAPDTKYPIQDQIGDDLVAEAIHYKKEIGDSLHFLVKWRDVQELSYVRDTVAYEKFPGVVLDFYERYILCFRVQ
ncbi:unnamed protein product [Macrosiphum euphorbiae]|uniref:Chromo shadow domain-containing protein n=1 Tax=Macrosiphum euphorbiae TaxID=13131 RepID=A0AAV0WSI7_9HEMI|nr:unnamed protein product [Macrosiphum euphorbiae]